MHVELTNGQSAEVRDPETVSRKERNALLEGLPEAPSTIGPNGKLVAGKPDFKLSMATLDRILAYIVESWTFDLVLPSEDVGVLDELMGADPGLLEAAANKFISVLMPDESSVPTQPPSTT